MDSNSSILLSGEMALRRQLEVTANNIANMDTTGFKREAPVFQAYVDKIDDSPVPANEAKRVNYVLDYGTVHDLTAGSFKPTGNPLDFMINGMGYFGVRTGEGGIAYTRNGHFLIDAAGFLVDNQGRQVMGADEQPIEIDLAQRTSVSVSASGAIRGAEGDIGRIGVYQFPNEGLVEQRGDGLFDGVGGEVAAADAVNLKVGGLESSNVNGVVETTALVEVQRRYEASRKISQSINELRRSAIQRLGRAD